MPKKLNDAQLKREKEVYQRIQKSPIYFIWLMWRLKPQPPLEHKKDELNAIVKSGDLDKIDVSFFETPPDEDGEKANDFERGKHITWQQWVILLAFEKAIRGEASDRISVASGHGIGKSTTMAWLLIWFLFAHKDSQVPATAPSENQMFDVLWKEIAKWLNKMPEPWKDKFEWQTKYVRVHDYPNSDKIWFARAKTARKENPEALAGVHAKHVLFLIDEASAVPQEIFNVAEGALTETGTFVLMISNPTRTVGYFFDSHNKDKESWQTFQFSSIDSPIPSDGYAERIAGMHGKDSDEYKIRVLGQFPDEDAVDDEGYAPMLNKKDIREVASMVDDSGKEMFTGTLYMGIDPAGEGFDKTSWVIRDAFKAKIVLEKDISDANSIASQTMYFIHEYNIDPSNIFIDMFGEGAKTCVKLASLGYDIVGVNVGDKPEDKDDADIFLNIRARNYYGRLRKWILSKGELVMNKAWKEELPIMRFRRSAEQNSKIQIMGKRKMRKEGYKSPNHADALMLTFCHDEDYATGNITTTTPSTRYKYIHLGGNNIHEQNQEYQTTFPNENRGGSVL